MRLRITSFNVENLFNRYAFLDQAWSGRNYERFITAVGFASIANRNGELVSEPTTTIQRNNTAMAILDVAPDILAVQEVENVYTLRNFNHDFLDDYFDFVYCLDGNDPRSIDVGLLIRKRRGMEVLGVRTHIDDRTDANRPVIRSAVADRGYIVENAVFSRDCLEVDVRIGNTTLTFLVNHFKSQDGTPASIVRRRQQADRVARIAQVAHSQGKKPIVIGDLNKDTAREYDGSLDALIEADYLADPFPAGPDLWTHYYASGRSVSRLDYILTDPSLEVVGTEIYREGLSTKARQYTGPRFPTIGPVHTEASDHCPTTVVLEI